MSPQLAATWREGVAQLMTAMGSVYEHITPEGFIRAFARTLAGAELPADFTPAPLHQRGILATMTEPAPHAVRLPINEALFDPPHSDPHSLRSDVPKREREPLLFRPSANRRQQFGNNAVFGDRAKYKTATER